MNFSTRAGRCEFSQATRKHLAAAAGHKCSIRGCLAPSTCVATKRDGTVGSVNLGKASHIYAAAPNGSRPAPLLMTPDHIGHQSNGIWTCSDCGDIVDRLKCDYSPFQLLKMRKVRETAEKMAVSDPQIRGISRYISPIEFDEVFWKNLPNLEADKIRPALLEIASRELLRLCERSSREISAPSRLPLKPLASAIKSIIEGDGDDALAVQDRVAAHPSCPYNRLAGDNHTAARRRAAEIVSAWAMCILNHYESGTRGLIHRVGALITARHPQTKEMCESAIRVVGDGYCRHERTSDEGEILHLKLTNTRGLVNNLNWQLNEAFDQGRVVTTSALRLAGRLSTRNFHSAQWDEEFDAYEQVVRKLSDGWQPIGFVEMPSLPFALDDRMHPEAFEIELQITSSELEECLYRCSKIRLARALEEQWGWGRWFECTEAYFERGLDPMMIQYASDELRARLGPPPYWYRGESAPLVSVGKCDIKLVVRHGVITFKSVPRRS